MALQLLAFVRDAAEVIVDLKAQNTSTPLRVLNRLLRPRCSCFGHPFSLLLTERFGLQ